MYPNLNAERARRNITLEEIAVKMNKRLATISNKFNGRYPITLNEAAQIKEIIGTDLPLEILFSTEAIKN